MFGRLTLDAFKHESSQNGAVFGMLLIGISLIILITYLKRWKYLWNEWFTTVDPKRIGIMYIIVVLIMFGKGFADAVMMRLQQVLSVGDAQGFISSSHFQEIFSSHGTTMIWCKRCCLSIFKRSQFLAFCRWRHINTSVTRHGQI
jgi:cytochrome o ubiquinol oxidase subunit 1